MIIWIIYHVLCRPGECKVISSKYREREKERFFFNPGRESLNSEEQIQPFQTSKGWENSSPLQETLKELSEVKKGRH